MNLTATRPGTPNPLSSLSKVKVRPNSVYTIIIILTLVAFEAFNYSTTAYALRDLLGDLRFAGMQWATLMAMAFCGLDFAGIATLITQKGKSQSHKDSWYLFSAWLIAAAFNATLTWWGVSLAISNHQLISSLIANTQSLTVIVPVIVAVMVWVIRILIIGTLTSGLEQTSQSRTSTARERQQNSSAGFPLNNQPVTAHSRPQSSSQPARSIAARANQAPVYRNYNAAPHQQRQSNDFMEAENRSRDL